MMVGWGTIAYGITAGVFFGVALVFFLFGARRRGIDPLMWSFGSYALASAISTVVTIRLHLSSTVDEYSTWFKVFGLANLASVVGTVILVAIWTRQTSRPAALAFGLATAAIGVLSAVLPNGLLAGDIEGLREVTLFGERFVVHEGTTSPWRPVVDAYLLILFVFMVVAIVRGFRHRQSYAAVVLGAVLIAAGVGYYDSLVDLGVVETPYLAPFGMITTVLAGAAFLAERSARTDARLHDQTVRLEETVIERTAAVIDANRRLEAQLVLQRRSTRSLASLTEEFERVNAMVDPTPTTIEASLGALLEQLGAILPAAAIELRMNENHFDDLLPRSLSWRHSDPPPDTAEPAAVSEPITIGNTPIGELIARPIAEHDFTADEARYLALTAEHLAGLIHRLELVGLVADTAIETERQRIAMDLHDSVTQRMYSVSFLADAAAHQARLDPTDLADSVDRIRELVLSSLSELRALLLELSPRAFAENALPALLTPLVESLASAYEADIVFDAKPVPPMPTNVKTALYRITQEALSNACRHSHADQITVALTHLHGTATLVIHDNGTGFDTAAMTNGSGMHNIRTRARHINADLDITSSPGIGTTITLQRSGSVQGIRDREGASA
jgi:signal transduction histidine kinase